MKGHLRSIEGARGLAALSVLVYHVGTQEATYGAFSKATQYYLWLGVQLFFCLSGFLLFQPFAASIISGAEWPSIRRYAGARIVRIGPAYWFLLTLTIVDTSSFFVMPPPGVFDQRLLPIAGAAIFLFVGAVMLRRGHGPLVPAVAACAAAVLLATHTDVLWRGFANYTLIYLPFRMRGEVDIAWTLCIEVAFYAVLPFFALAVRRLARNTRRPALVTVLCLLPAFPISYEYTANEGLYTRAFPVWLPGYLDEFAIGMLLAVALQVRPTISAWASRVLLVGAAGVFVIGHELYHVGTLATLSRGSGVAYARIMEVGFALVLASVLMRQERTLIGRLLSSRPLVALGTISYGVYLWHPFFLERWMNTSLWTNWWTAMALVLSSSLAAASMSWLFIEKRALRHKNFLVAWHPSLRPSWPAGRPAPQPVVDES